MRCTGAGMDGGGASVAWLSAKPQRAAWVVAAVSSGAAAGVVVGVKGAAGAKDGIATAVPAPTASARRSADVARLRETILAIFRRELVEAELFLPWSAQQLRGEIYARCEVLEERADGEGAFLLVRSDPGAVRELRERLSQTHSL